MVEPVAPGSLGPADGRTIWFTGLPCSGKTTLASGLAARLRRQGYRVEVLDGDVVRTHLTKDLGFSREDRRENVRRIGFVAHLLSRNGIVVICACVSPYRDDREEVRAMHGDRFCEIHVSAPVEVCAERDVKGLYARQRAGSLHGLTGVDDPYEAPINPELVVPTHRLTVEESIDQIWEVL
ncbi:MAG: adenylylsulfate kinase [Actinomycetota bacterium]|jgi:adenylylsulfate kinase|nr:adenylylsulfate kinase [Actinomycetota bacterium]